jgi:hypothetical protein
LTRFPFYGSLSFMKPEIETKFYLHSYVPASTIYEHAREVSIQSGWSVPEERKSHRTYYYYDTPQFSFAAQHKTLRQVYFPGSLEPDKKYRVGYKTGVGDDRLEEETWFGELQTPAQLEKLFSVAGLSVTVMSSAIVRSFSAIKNGAAVVFSVAEVQGSLPAAVETLGCSFIELECEWKSGPRDMMIRLLAYLQGTTSYLIPNTLQKYTRLVKELYPGKLPGR